MSITVKIPTQLRPVTGGESEASVEDATTVGEVLDGLYDRYDGLRDRIAVDGDLRRFVNVYVGGEDIRFLDGLDTAVEGGDEVTILPAVAGGRQTGARGRRAEYRRPHAGWGSGGGADAGARVERRVARARRRSRSHAVLRRRRRGARCRDRRGTHGPRR